MTSGYNERIETVTDSEPHTVGKTFPRERPFLLVPVNVPVLETGEFINQRNRFIDPVEKPSCMRNI